MAIENIILWVLLGAVAGIIYSLKRVYSMEKTILSLESKINSMVKKPKRKPAKRKKKK